MKVTVVTVDGSSLTRDFEQLMRSLQVREDRPEANEIVVLVVSLVASVCRNLHVSVTISTAAGMCDANCDY